MPLPLPSVYLRDGALQRCGRTIRDSGQHHQRFCPAAERGTQGVSFEGPPAFAQGQKSQRLSPTTRLLCSTIFGEGSEVSRLVYAGVSSCLLSSSLGK